MISSRVRDLLIEHIGGPVAIHVRRQSCKDAGRPQLVQAALRTGLLRPDVASARRPQFTVITDAGREELAIALADWADALVRAKYNRESLPPLAADFLPESSAKSA